MKEVAAAFGLGELHEVSFAARGAMGTISKVVTSTGTFAVKELFPWNSGAGAESEAVVTAEARSHGVVVPRELRTAAGELVTRANDVLFRAYEWVELDHDAPRSAAAAGHILGTLHRHAIVDDHPLEPWYDTPPDADRWQAILQAAADEPWCGGLEALLPHLMELATIKREPAPRFTCHRDFDPGNVVPLRAGGLAVLDWENAGPLELDQEVATLLLWAPDALPAYGQARGLTPVLTRSSYATAAAVWLNFLADCAHGAAQVETAPDHRAAAQAFVDHALAQPLEIPAP